MSKVLTKTSDKALDDAYKLLEQQYEQTKNQLEEKWQQELIIGFEKKSNRIRSNGEKRKRIY